MNNTLSIFEYVANPMWHTDEYGSYIYFNQAWLKFTGHTAEQIKNVGWIHYVHPDDRNYCQQTFAQAQHEKKEFTREYRLLHYTGEYHWIVDSGCPIFDKEKGFQGYIGTAYDITTEKLAQQKILHLTRLYAILSQTNQAIVHIHSREDLFRRVCEIAIEYGGFQMAWIGLINREKQILEPVSHSGLECDYLSKVKFPLHSEGEITAASIPVQAVLKNHYTYCNFTAEERQCTSCPYPSLCPVDFEAIQRGYRATASFPIHVYNETIGVFTLHVTEADFFNTDELELLEEMMTEVSFAIESLFRENQRRAATQELQKLSLAVEQSANMVIIMNMHGLIEYVNPKFTEITKYTKEEVIGQNYELLLFPEKINHNLIHNILPVIQSGQAWHGEFHSIKRNGQSYWCLASISPVKNDTNEITHFVMIAEDIEERKSVESMIEHLAFYDPLTELPNRRLFRDRLNQAIMEAQETNKWVVLLYLDLDRFKYINDSLGYQYGDFLLKEVASRLKKILHKGDTLARLSGDEFTIILNKVDDLRNIYTTADLIMQVFERSFSIEQHEVYITASLGITVSPLDGTDSDELIRNADIAMYRAKELGRNTYQLYKPEMNANAYERLSLENSLRGGLQREEFIVYYQPQIDLSTHQIVGAEALVRWQHSEKGLVSPAKFIPVAEETGLIVPLGEWVLKTACAQTKAWHDAGLPKIRMAVNLSARQFQQKNLFDLIQEILIQTGLKPEYLELEITESMLMENVEEAIGTLHKLKALGLAISIDDFGTGYSSLNYLKRFPIDMLKIDQSFVRDITTDPDDAIIASTIITMAHSLRFKVIAEGVEHKDHLTFLKSKECDIAQGYLFSRPLPTALFGELLRHNDFAIIDKD